ncbi:MAG: YncE family protein [Candidatus Nitrosopolaris sp.]
MKRTVLTTAVLLISLFTISTFVTVPSARAGQAPGSSASPDIPVSHHDRVYTADQFSNTVTVTDPVDNKLLGVIRLGGPIPSNLSPLYGQGGKQLLVHGMLFSPNHRTVVVVSIASNAIAFIDTATNTVKHITYVGRSPHEAAFTQDGKEVWVSVRGENYISVLNGTTYREMSRIIVPNGPGMQIFSPDGKYAYVCSSFTPETVVISVANHTILGRVPQASPFCPNIAVTPDGKQVWFTLKDFGKTEVFDAQPPFSVLKIIDTGPITNHVNIVHNSKGTFAYVTIGGLNEVKVFRTDNFAHVAIPVGELPHGIWPSGDGTRIYTRLENGDRLVAIDTLTNKMIGSSPIGQACQAIAYVPNAVPEGNGTQKLQPLGMAGNATHLYLVAPFHGKAMNATLAPTSIALWDQGLVQVLQAAVTGLQPNHHYVLALSRNPNGSGPLVPALQQFMTNPAGAAIVNTIGPIRQILQEGMPPRYLVIVPGTAACSNPVE